MTNRRANYPPVPADRHQRRKTKPFAFHRTPMNEAVRRAFNPDRYSPVHPSQPPLRGFWGWYERCQRALRRGLQRLKRLFS